MKLNFATCNSVGHIGQPASLSEGNHQVLIGIYLSGSKRKEICRPFIKQSGKNAFSNAHKLREQLVSVIFLHGYILLILFVVPEIKCKTV